jgi:regulatory protein
VSAPRSLKARALQWLAQREQSRSELRRKLLRLASAESQAGAEGDKTTDGADDEIADSAAQRVETLLDWLAAHDFLSHERFVESRVHARSARFGNLRIRQELKQQHQLTLPSDVAQALNASELQRAREVRRRKFAAWPANAAERAKQQRYLAGRGFSPDAIAQALRPRPDADEAMDT